MRQITIDAIQALLGHNWFHRSNTKVMTFTGCEVIPDYYGRAVILYLHDHPIIIKTVDHIFIQNCGYFTNVTKERLNGLDGVNIVQRQGEWYLNGEKWDGELTKIETL